MINALITQASAEVANDDLTEQVLDALMRLSKAEIRAEVWSLVANEIRLTRRNATRAIESSGGQAADPGKPRRDLLAESFFVSPERGYIAWGEATVDDHLIRAAYLRHMAGGLIGTAKKHEDTAKLLRAKNAPCLYELRQAVAA